MTYCKPFSYSCCGYGVNFQHPVSSENHLWRHVHTVNPSNVHAGGIFLARLQIMQLPTASIFRKPSMGTWLTVDYSLYCCYGVNFQDLVSSENYLWGHVRTVNTSCVYAVGIFEPCCNLMCFRLPVLSL